MNDDARVDIDRITISVSGIDADLARRLGQAVGQRLAPALAPAAGDALLDHIAVELPESRGEGLDALAGRIVSEVAGAVAPRATEAGR